MIPLIQVLTCYWGNCIDIIFKVSLNESGCPSGNLTGSCVENQLSAKVFRHYSNFINEKISCSKSHDPSFKDSSISFCRKHKYQTPVNCSSYDYFSSNQSQSITETKTLLKCPLPEEMILYLCPVSCIAYRIRPNWQILINRKSFSYKSRWI